MNEWPHVVEPYTMQEVQEYCVQDEPWQRFRLTLKGLATSTKLVELDRWCIGMRCSRRTRVQVDNYINALKRGGQLDLEGNVVR